MNSETEGIKYEVVIQNSEESMPLKRNLNFSCISVASNYKSLNFFYVHSAQCAEMFSMYM